MLRKYGILAVLLARIREYEIHAQRFFENNSNSSIGEDVLKDLEKWVVVPLQRVSPTADLDACTHLLDRMLEKIKSQNYPAKENYDDLRDLNSRLVDQLRERWFFYLSPSKYKYHEDKQLFGDEVETAFPAAIGDIEDAGKCLAFGRGTSCVMHLMRVMEAGLKALAHSLGIPYAPSWENYLSQIQSRIDTKHKLKGIQWKRHEKFFRDASGDLISVKQAWRNPSMHLDRRYTPEEAEEVFKAVRSFMQRLAKGLPKKPVPSKKISPP